MTTTQHPSTDTAGEVESQAGARRFGVRAALAWFAVVAGMVPFLLLWALVQRRWSPLAGLDGEVAAGLNDAVSGSGVAVDVLRYVTDLGGHEFAILAFVLITAFLLVRRRPRLAAFAAVTGIGMAVLGPVTKALVGRARPVVEAPVIEVPSNASFPSGHAMTSLVTWGVVLLLVLPTVHRRTRPWLVAGAVLVVVAVGFSRLALGVHFVSDVLAGWALGACWLAVATLVFRAWQHERGDAPHEPLDPLEVPPGTAPHLTVGPEPALPRGRRDWWRLAGAAAALWAAFTAVGLLVVRTDSWLADVDRAVVTWFAGIRTGTLTTVSELVGSLADTRVVVSVGLAVAVLGAAVTRSRRPVVLVALAVAGETLLYVAVSQVVGRIRPETVDDLTHGLPGGASYPSGHAAAAVAVYGSLAALVLVTSRSRRRWAVLALPVVLAPAVAVSRLYVAAHYPSDVVAGLLLGTLWVLVCARVVLADRHPAQPPADVRTVT